MNIREILENKHKERYDSETGGLHKPDEMFAGIEQLILAHIGMVIDEAIKEAKKDRDRATRYMSNEMVRHEVKTYDEGLADGAVGMMSGLIVTLKDLKTRLGIEEKQ